MSESKDEFRIEDVDRNLVTSTTVTEPDLVWHDARRSPFTVHGLLYDEEQAYFLRMPQGMFDTISAGDNNFCRRGLGCLHR